MIESKGSVFSSLRAYLGDIGNRIRSVWGSGLTAAPYLFSMGEFRKEITEQYPDPISSRTPDDLPPRTRGLLYNDIERCLGCRACEEVCPTDCFKIETEPGSDASKVWVATFDIDFARCTFCGLCVEACQPQSLMHTKQYEGAVYRVSEMAGSFGKGYVTPQLRAKWASMRQAQEDEESGGLS